MRHEPEPHVLLFKVGTRILSPLFPSIAFLTKSFLSALPSQRDKDYDQKHPPLTERRTQPQVQQRQAVTQNSS